MPQPSLTTPKWQGGRLPRAEVDRRIARLLDIALDEFVQHGFGGASLDRLVALSGVSKTTIYRRFGSKEGLFTTLIGQSVELIRTALRDLRLDPEDPAGSIAAFVRIYSDIAVVDPLGRALLGIALGERTAFPSLGRELLQNAYVGLQPLSDLIAELMARGVLRQGDPMEAAFDLQGLITQGFRAFVDDIAFISEPGRPERIAERFLKGWR